MGRRILPKMDRSVVYSHVFRELSELESSFLPQSWFPSEQPLEIEVGSGKGLFLLTQSGIHPHRNYLGIEIAKKYARYSAYRFAKHDRNNARMLRGDALKFLTEFVPPDSVAALHIYFPDPWWKAKHRKRRVVSQAMAIQAERVLVPGGAFHFWTDVQEYYETGCEEILQVPGWDGPHIEEPLIADPATPYQTHFERRMIINDHDVFRCQFLKQARKAPVDNPSLQKTTLN
jgi:tRNA (guanine-N7-)-methyltransferase